MRALAAWVALVLAGCVAYSPVVETTSTHKPGMAYLAGVFVDQGSDRRYKALGISYEHLETATTHAFEFQKQGNSDLQLIAVPPGTYRVQSWFMTAFGNEVLVRGKPQGALFTREFKVAPDQVHFVGSYVGSGSVRNSGSMVYYNANLRPLRILPGPADEKAFAARYPNLGKVPVKAAYL